MMHADLECYGMTWMPDMPAPVIDALRSVRATFNRLQSMEMDAARKGDKR